MTDEEALRTIQGLCAAGRYHISRHAWERMIERSATPRDVLRAVATATRARHQPHGGTWRVLGGADLVGDDLTVIVALEGQVVVVTIF